MSHEHHTVIYGADTETDNDGMSAWICQWAVVRMKDRSKNVCPYTEVHGYTLSQFTAYIDSLFEFQSTKHVIYFHNLKYDMQFFRGYLFELQERYRDDPDKITIIMRSGKPIILRFDNVEFRDSANKMPAGTTVLQMGEMVGIPKLESPRGSFASGWSKDLTDDDFQYVIHDALIVGTIMQRMHRLKRTHATASGDAWASLKAIYNKHHNVNGFGEWNSHYPELTHDIDRWLRPGYFGGINISQHIGYNEGEITHEDVNSMYPTVMLYDVLPFGTPIKLTKGTPYDYDYKLWVIKADMKFHIKDGMLPWLRFKYANDRILENMGATDYVTHTDNWHNMTLTNIDLENISRFYDIEISPQYVQYVVFESEIGANSEYINHWFHEKAIAPKNSVERLAAKLMLNSAYGRFGMSAIEENVTFVFDDELQDYIPESVEGLSEEVPGYLPFAMFVTAHARRRLCDNILAVGCENVIHCDTDSVIHFGKPSSMGHTDALGDWGIESTPKVIYEGGVKRYIELMRLDPQLLDDINLTCAGVPQRQKNNVPSGMWIELLDKPARIYDTGTILGTGDYRVESDWLREILINNGINPNHVDTRKLLPKRVKGGVILTPSSFKLHDSMEIRFR